MPRISKQFPFVLALFLMMSTAFLGQNKAAAEDLSEKLRLTMSKARVTQVTDAQTIIVNNTTTINLPMLYIPWESAQEKGEAVKNAKDFLEKELKDRFIRVYQVRDQKRGQLDSLGHVQGFVERDDGLWIQKAMVENGLAFVYPTQSHFEYADELLEAEEKARTDKIGLWSDPKWSIATDQEAKSLKDRFAIVQGRVEKIITKNNTIYLNFERDWKTDFTAAIDSSRRREFSKAGGNPMQWSGKTIRVRGWLRDYNGPYIEIFHPSQVQVIEEEKEDKK